MDILIDLFNEYEREKTVQQKEISLLECHKKLNSIKIKEISNENKFLEHILLNDYKLFIDVLSNKTIVDLDKYIFENGNYLYMENFEYIPKNMDIIDWNYKNKDNKTYLELLCSKENFIFENFVNEKYWKNIILDKNFIIQYYKKIKKQLPECFDISYDEEIFSSYVCNLKNIPKWFKGEITDDIIKICIKHGYLKDEWIDLMVNFNDTMLYINYISHSEKILPEKCLKNINFDIVNEDGYNIVIYYIMYGLKIPKIFKEKIDINKIYKNGYDIATIHIINNYTEPPKWIMKKYNINNFFIKISMDYLGYIPSYKKKEQKYKLLRDTKIDNICPICQEQLSNKIIETWCKHHFCANCISEIEKNNCPLCRQTY